MARYRRIDIRMWGDEKFVALSKPQPCGQVLWFHLLAGEQTDIIPGLFRVGESAFAEQIGWSLKAFRESFREVSREGLAKADWQARLVWVPNAPKYNPPHNPNVVTSWREAWDELPECGLKTEVWWALKAYCEGLSEAFGKAFRDACPKPLAKQDQDQDQENTYGSQSEKPTAPAAPAAAPDEPETPFVAYARIAWPKLKDPAGFERAERDAHPTLDLLAETKKARAWAASNPQRAPRAKFSRFLHGWFARAAEQSTLNGTGPPAQKPRTVADLDPSKLYPAETA